MTLRRRLERARAAFFGQTPEDRLQDYVEAAQSDEERRAREDQQARMVALYRSRPIEAGEHARQGAMVMTMPPLAARAAEAVDVARATAGRREPEGGGVSPSETLRERDAREAAEWRRNRQAEMDAAAEAGAEAWLEDEIEATGAAPRNGVAE